MEKLTKTRRVSNSRIVETVKVASDRPLAQMSGAAIECWAQDVAAHAARVASGVLLLRRNSGMTRNMQVKAGELCAIRVTVEFL